MLNYKGEMSNLTLFGGTSPQIRVRDELQGEDITGPYLLTRVPIVPETEQVEIEMRDKLSDRVISSTRKTRHRDYTIDYDVGRIIFDKPIPSLSGGEGYAYIIITYEYIPDGQRSTLADGAEKHYIYGARGVTRISDRLTLGGTYISESQSPKDWKLVGTDVVAALADNLSIVGEYAQIEPSKAVRKRGTAKSVEALFAPLPSVTLKPFYRRVEPHFDHPINPFRPKSSGYLGKIGLHHHDISQLSHREGIEEKGLLIDSRPIDRLTLLAQYKHAMDTSEPSQTVHTRTSALGAEYQLPGGFEGFTNYESTHAFREKARRNRTQITTVSLFIPTAKWTV